MEAAATDRYFRTGDDVRLHYRDFPGGREGQPVILCLPGLTRNARDFEALAGRLAPRFRVLAVSFRGRGESAAAADPLSYVPQTYVQDLGQLLADAGIGRVVVIGTSLGGLVGVLLAMANQPEVAGLVLNDVGPVLGEAGLARIRSAIGRGDNWPSWLVAAREIARLQGAVYPEWTLESWLTHAKRLCRIAADGRIVWDYDPEILAPFKEAEAAGPLDFWPAFEAIAGRPMLSIRGQLSDILSAETQAEMAARLPGLQLATAAAVGHAPTLDEAEALQAIEHFLQPFI